MLSVSIPAQAGTQAFRADRGGDLAGRAKSSRMKASTNLNAIGLATATALILSGAPSTGVAKSASYSAEFQRCIDAAGGMDSRSAQCEAEEAARQDKVLNKVYRDLLSSFTGARREALIKAERGWVAYREVECAFRASGETGGTLASVIEQGCILDLTIDRVAALKNASEIQKKAGT